MLEGGNENLSVPRTLTFVAVCIDSVNMVEAGQSSWRLLPDLNTTGEAEVYV